MAERGIASATIGGMCHILPVVLSVGTHSFLLESLDLFPPVCWLFIVASSLGVASALKAESWLFGLMPDRFIKKQELVHLVLFAFV